MAELGRYNNPVAKNNYRCEWCYGLIPKGEKHWQYIGMFQGDFQYWRAHEECYQIMQADDDICEEGFLPGEGEKPSRVKELESK